MLTIRPVGKLSLLKLSIILCQVRVFESQFRNNEMLSLMAKCTVEKLMLRGESSIRFSAEQKNKTSFSLLVQFFSDFSKIGPKKLQFSQFRIASIKLGVGLFLQ